MPTYIFYHTNERRAASRGSLETCNRACFQRLKDGRPVGTRTPDLYRVKVAL